jgi:chromosome partitioning protein
MINRNVKISEAPSHSRPVLLYDAVSTGAQNYMGLAAELMKRNLVTEKTGLNKTDE